MVATIHYFSGKILFYKSLYRNYWQTNADISCYAETDHAYSYCDGCTYLDLVTPNRINLFLYLIVGIMYYLSRIKFIRIIVILK